MESRIDGLLSPEAPDCQSRARQQHQRDSNLYDHKRTAQTMTPRAASVSAFSERFSQIRPGCPNARRQAEDESGEERGDECKNQDPVIDVHFPEARNEIRQYPHEQIQSPGAGQQAKTAANTGIQQAFG